MYCIITDYDKNARDNQDRRDRKDATLREQWAAALAAKSSWAFLCASCIDALGASLIGTDVIVWWHDDEVSYRGELHIFELFVRLYSPHHSYLHGSHCVSSL